MEKNLMISFFDALAPTWDTSFPADPQKLRALALLADLHPGMRILDAACGTSPMLPFLLESDPAAVLAVDFSPAMLEAARAKCADSRVEFLCQDVMELNRIEFDRVILAESFQHFENRGSIVRQMHHLLSPGGRVVICHCEGRTTVNSHYQANAAALSMPLPAARTLAASLERYFDVDILIDSPQLYVVSGIRRPL